MSDLVGNPEYQFSRFAALSLTVCLYASATEDIFRSSACSTCDQLKLFDSPEPKLLLLFYFKVTYKIVQVSAVMSGWLSDSDT